MTHKRILPSCSAAPIKSFLHSSIYIYILPGVIEVMIIIKCFKRYNCSLIIALYISIIATILYNYKPLESSVFPFHTSKYQAVASFSKVVFHSIVIDGTVRLDEILKNKK